MPDYEKGILELFDRCPERKQVIALAKMYVTTPEKITEILQKNGREIPIAKKGPKPKKWPLEEDVKKLKDAVENAHSEIMPVNEQPIQKIPDCVANTITKRIGELETDIKNHQEMVKLLEAEYTAHVNFLMSCPFEQRNLSQDCSDDKHESPQPQG